VVILHGGKASLHVFTAIHTQLPFSSTDIVQSCFTMLLHKATTIHLLDKLFCSALSVIITL